MPGYLIIETRIRVLLEDLATRYGAFITIVRYVTSYPLLPGVGITHQTGGARRFCNLTHLIPGSQDST